VGGVGYWRGDDSIGALFILKDDQSMAGGYYWVQIRGKILAGPRQWGVCGQKKHRRRGTLEEG